MASFLTRILGGRTGADQPREVSRTDAEWRSQLSALQYRVLRRKGTERPFSGLHVHPSSECRTFRCAACGTDLFSGDSQFDSGTGWPSFADALEGTVELRRDLSLGLPRTEARCRRCGGHLGHLFRDGPRPGGMRYCINSAALEVGGRDAESGRSPDTATEPARRRVGP